MFVVGGKDGLQQVLLFALLFERCCAPRLWSAFKALCLCRCRTSMSPMAPCSAAGPLSSLTRWYASCVETISSVCCRASLHSRRSLLPVCWPTRGPTCCSLTRPSHALTARRSLSELPHRSESGVFVLDRVRSQCCSAVLAFLASSFKQKSVSRAR